MIHLDLPEVLDVLNAMRSQEEKFYKCRDYVSEFKRTIRNDSGNVPVVDQECREMMCNWCYQVVDFCSFEREIVSIAFSYLDRFLSTEQGSKAICDSRAYQLVSMTTLYMAVKVHETVAMDPGLLAQLSRDAYRDKEFEEMETQILHSLEWRVTGPTPLAFLRCFKDYLPNSVEATVQNAIMNCSQQEVELAVCDYNLCVNHLPSEIALRAVVNVIGDIDENMMSLDTKREFICAVEKFSGLDAKETLDIPSCMDAEPDTTMTTIPDDGLTSLKSPSCAYPNSPTSPAERDMILD